MTAPFPWEPDAVRFVDPPPLFVPAIGERRFVRGIGQVKPGTDEGVVVAWRLVGWLSRGSWVEHSEVEGWEWEYLDEPMQPLVEYGRGALLPVEDVALGGVWTLDDEVRAPDLVAEYAEVRADAREALGRD